MSADTCQFSNLKVGDVVALKVTNSTCYECGAYTNYEADARYQGHAFTMGALHDCFVTIKPFPCPSCGVPVTTLAWECGKGFYFTIEASKAERAARTRE